MMASRTLNVQNFVPSKPCDRYNGNLWYNRIQVDGEPQSKLLSIMYAYQALLSRLLLIVQINESRAKAHPQVFLELPAFYSTNDVMPFTVTEVFSIGIAQ